MNEKDTCPNQEDGRHRFHIYRITDVYEQRITPDKYKPIVWYEKVEYAYSGCNCGAAHKERIRQGDDI